MKKDKTMLEKIIEYCSKNGITSYELAKNLPLSQVALHGILSGATSQPRIKNVQLIYDFLFSKNTTTANEPELVYETGYDKKIHENEEKIHSLKREIEQWEEKKEVNPEKASTYNKYIDSLNEQIFLLNEIINITLEAKKDFLEDNN